ncbi:sensor histidine kinase [Streptococcus dentapri]|uniref:histidine kinase n=1 Tax=Streptococcus dentapri TaxID=573564 RepID=A0ABV8CZK8_9STRE
MGIVRKNFLIVTSMIIATVLVLLAVIYYAMPIYYNQAKQVEIKKDYQTIVKQLDGKSKKKLLSQIAAYDKTNPNLLLTLMDDSGKILYPDASDKEAVDQRQTYLAKGQFDQIGSWSKLITSSEGVDYIIQAEYGFQSLSGISQILLTFYPFILILIVSLASLVAYVYSRLSNKRIQTISETTRKMMDLEEGLACQISGQDEIANLAQNINQLYKHLLKSIEELKQENQRTAERERQQADFLRITSHELKTPIASNLALVEGMLYNVGDFKNHDTYLRKSRDILQEQSALVQSVLDATNLNIGIKSHQENIDVKSLIEQNLDSYHILAEMRSYQFSSDLTSCQVTANPAYLLKAIKNLLDNAFRYTREGGIIHLSLADDCLILENQAEQLLTDEELKHIFQPFYRPDFSRDRKDGGTGMGLYIVQQILEQHGFSYQFKREKDKMRFVLFFKKRSQG